jgi:hypothetical protein
MMKRIVLAGVLVTLLAAGSAVAQPLAGDCLVGPGVGSSLLYPYFEVDLANPFNVTTLVSVNNALSSVTLVRVVLWTDWGVPTLAFDLYLDIFDVQTINLRDLFAGVVPSTGEGADLSEFPFCDLFPPFHVNPALNGNQQAQLAAYHTGVAGPLDAGCAGENHGDQVARGYLTADVIDECNGIELVDPVFTPADPLDWPYFDNGVPGPAIAVNSERLWGDAIYLDVANAAAQGAEAVALWADSVRFAGAGIFTFYGRFTGYDARDDRVPLSSLWNQRFVNGGPFAGGADLIVWRDPISPAASPVACGTQPPWYPLASDALALNENSDDLVDLGSPFPLVTQRVDVDTLGIPYPFGWIQIDSDLSQAWVVPTLRAGGLYSAAWNGTPVASVCDQSPPPPP